jgi:EAL domain-containing protein (putative c-di-GMP-specific phosphodiesterase class I)
VAQTVAAAVIAELNALPQPWRQQAQPLAATAATSYTPGEEVGALMARLDNALATAEGNDGYSCVVAPVDTARPLGNQEWRSKLLHALEHRWLRLDAFETRTFDGSLSHRECFVRLRLDEDGEWLPAASFLPHVARLNLTADFDLAVAGEMARFGSATDKLALNLSPDSLGASGFGARLAAIVTAAPGLAQRLWIDAPEKGIFQFPDGFRDLLQHMKAIGCRVGVDHFGHEFDRIGQLYGIGLDYVKIDASFINGLTDSPGNRNFLKGVCAICHNMGMEIHALGVATEEDLAVLPELGFDGATGPAVKR